MYPAMPLKLKILITVIGLSAIVLPIFLIAVDFNPVGYFYQPTVANKKSDIITPTTEAELSAPSNLALISVSEFQRLENDTSFLVINLDAAVAKTNSTYLNMTRGELNTILQEEWGIPSLLKTNKVILVSSDVVSGEEMAKKLMEKGLQVFLYLNHE